MSKVAAIPNISGDQSMLCWLALVPSGSLYLLTVSRMGSVFLLSGPSVEILGVPFFGISLPIGHSFV